MRLLLLLLMLTLPTGTWAKTILSDRGGEITARIAEINTLEHTKTPVRIMGTCASACTLYLKLPKTCVSPNASLGFHGPSGSTGLRGIPLAEYKSLVSLMAAHYPHGLDSWFLTNAAYEMDTVIWLKGSTLISMGFTPCA